MRRLIIALAIATPLLGGCLIIANDEPDTQVVHQTPAE